MKKYFTVAEANKQIPVLEREIKALQQLQKEYQEHYRQLQHLRQTLGEAAPGNDPFFELEAKMDFLNIQAQFHFKLIAETGGQLKDIEIGLVDFLALRGSEEVNLCWKMGEEEIRHWHGLNEGFSGRKKIDELFI